MLLLESRGLHLSRWTQWELSFAHIYHFGILALNVNAAPHERGIEVSDRYDVTTNHLGELSDSDLQRAVDFIVRRYNIAESRRRVYFEALLRRAALNAGGTISARPDGLVEVSGKGHRALVLPSGRPANLVDLSKLGRACSLLQPNGPTSILIGQHEHLAPDMRQDVKWLAQDIEITMASTVSVFRSIQNLIQSGRP
jgi:hypothetical protein